MSWSASRCWRWSSRMLWVVANFKETQLTNMRVGQKVSVEVDGYPGIKFAAHVDSIQRGSGAYFSLLPPENATGNYVKVVQRVPVKIVFDDPAQVASGTFGAGHVRGADGTTSARRTRQPPGHKLDIGCPHVAHRRVKRPAWRPSVNPWLIAGVGDAGDDPRGAGHLGRQRGLAPHRRQPLGQHRRGHLGADQLPDLQRHRAADDGLAGGLFGRKRFLIGCIVVFTPASAACGAAPAWDSWCSPASSKGRPAGRCNRSPRPSSWRVSRPTKRGVAMAVFGMGVVVAPIIGPVWAAGSPTPTPGAGSSTSTSPRLLAVFMCADVPGRPALPPPATSGAAETSIIVGFGAMALWLATLQMILDRGQQDDWFKPAGSAGPRPSPLFHDRLHLLGIALEHPLVNLRVLGNRNFAGDALIAAVGVVLYSTTALLPLFLRN